MSSDLLFIDATFYDNSEINYRPIESIPHPFVSETIEYLKNLFTEKLGIRLALDKVFNFGEKDIRMMFFRIGGVTLEVIENPDSESLFFGGVGWHSENISKCHKRLIDSNFDLSEIRKGRKPGTIVATIRNAPLKMPTIIIGLDD